MTTPEYLVAQRRLASLLGDPRPYFTGLRASVVRTLRQERGLSLSAIAELTGGTVDMIDGRDQSWRYGL